MRTELEQLAEKLGVAGLVDWPGFLGAQAVSRELAGAVALCLVGVEEQWGLVVNEALAVGLPVVASWCVGACDTLVREGQNGFVVEPDDAAQIADALATVSRDEGTWIGMSERSRERAWLGDTERFADGVEVLAGVASEKTLASASRLDEANRT